MAAPRHADEPRQSRRAALSLEDDGAVFTPPAVRKDSREHAASASTSVSSSFGDRRPQFNRNGRIAVDLPAANDVPDVPSVRTASRQPASARPVLYDDRNGREQARRREMRERARTRSPSTDSRRSRRSRSPQADSRRSRRSRSPSSTVSRRSHSPSHERPPRPAARDDDALEALHSRSSRHRRSSVDHGPPSAPPARVLSRRGSMDAATFRRTIGSSGSVSSARGRSPPLVGPRTPPTPEVPRDDQSSAEESASPTSRRSKAIAIASPGQPRARLESQSSFHSLPPTLSPPAVPTSTLNEGREDADTTLNEHEMVIQALEDEMETEGKGNPILVSDLRSRLLKANPTFRHSVAQSGGLVEFCRTYKQFFIVFDPVPPATEHSVRWRKIERPARFVTSSSRRPPVGVSPPSAARKRATSESSDELPSAEVPVPLTGPTDHSTHDGTEDVNRRIDHLVFVIHGIGGGLLAGDRVKHHRATVATTCYQVLKDYYDVDFKLDFELIEWRSSLSEYTDDSDEAIRSCTLRGAKSFRDFANDIFLDAMYFMHNIYNQAILMEVQAQLNDKYNTYRKRYKNFSGKVSVFAHSLGSVIMWDILDPDPTQQFAMGMSGTPRKHAVSPDSRLDFHVENFFASGSPLAVFLSIRKKAFRKDFVAPPSCSHFYNLFHPYDPVAYRIEPLVAAAMRQVSPVRISYQKNDQRFHHSLKDRFFSSFGIKKSVPDKAKSDQQSPVGSPVGPSSLEREMGLGGSAAASTRQPPKDPDGVLPDLPPGTVYGPQPASVGVSTSTSDAIRHDYELQESLFENMNETLTAVRAHHCYWAHRDIAAFVIKALFRNDEQFFYLSQ